MSSPSNVAARCNQCQRLIAKVTTSISDPRRTALVVHVERCGARRRFLIRAFLQAPRQCSNSLAMVQFAFSILVEPSSVTVPC